MTEEIPEADRQNRFCRTDASEWGVLTTVAVRLARKAVVTGTKPAQDSDKSRPLQRV
ncbi:MAG: hypothetical protein KDA80_19130 [Planctomycetaceae bacterium]|nr:hypothetical protein [Planctomycetaceae bacterium]